MTNSEKFGKFILTVTKEVIVMAKKLTRLQKAESNAGLFWEDVQSIATDIFKVELTEDQIIEALELYPYEVEDDPTGDWTEIMEQTLYNIGLEQ